MSLLTIISVAAGGAFGALLRYFLETGGIRIGLSGHLSIFLINLMGAILIGVLYSMTQRFELNQNIILLLGTGVLGAFTTYSAMGMYGLMLSQNFTSWSGIVYCILQGALAIPAVLVGSYLGKLP